MKNFEDKARDKMKAAERTYQEWKSRAKQKRKSSDDDGA